jgi:hypothetical protein
MTASSRWMVVARLCLAAMILPLAACAVLQEKPEEVVAKRAQERWDDLVRGDFKAAYQFLSPGSRSVESEEDYVKSLRRDFWKSAQVKKVTCDGDVKCDVEMAIGYEFRGMHVTTPLHEKWIREGSEWWYLFR